MFVSKAAVVGGGTMGGEIAQAIAAADIPVVVKDIDQKFVDAAVEKARNIGPQTTVGEVRQIRSNLESSFREYARAAEKVAKPEATNLQAAVSEFRKNANNVKSQSTLAQTRDQLKNDAEQVKTANTQLKEKLNCGIGGAGESGSSRTRQRQRTASPACG